MLALQALCVYETVGEAFDADLSGFLRDESNYEDLAWDEPVDNDTLARARRLAQGTWHKRNEIDGLLSGYVEGWSLQRMQPVDRNILRLGMYELLEERNTPFQVVINEAIELARHFGGAESPAFVNGVLDGLRRKIEAERATGVTVTPAPESPRSEEA